MVITVKLDQLTIETTCYQYIFFNPELNLIEL